MLLAAMKNVVFGYGDRPSLEEVDLEIHSGEFVAVTGPNGASKTTLLKLLLGLLQPWSGHVQRAKELPGGKKLVVGYVPQQVAAFNSGFPSKVLEFVRSGTHMKGSWLRRDSRDDLLAAERALRQVGMWEHRERKIGELSGGQKQRICIARALAMGPNLLVLDEPANGMDADSRGKLYALLNGLVKEHGLTILMVTHNLSEVDAYLDRRIHLERREAGGWKCCTTTSCKGHFSPVG